MKISLFNQCITIEKNTVVVDKIGNHKNVWEEYFFCHAYVSTSSKAGESEEAGVTVQEESVVFSVRYCSEIAVLTTDDYRIRFRDATYNITSIDRMNFQNEGVKISAQKERRE